MPEVDPATGLPKETIDSKSTIEKFNRLEGQKMRSQTLTDDIKSERGQVILNKIKEHFLGRINKLIEEDGECKAFKKLLVDMGIQINMGEIAVERLMRLVEKKQTP